eukprot:TRINITY_DN34202_c0_g1_i1.p1 TRINITY_DN34202_c0_g1~~TRINITY_DN34202_c0_g1_i1.p1  ORF type:complete len:187 (-),score=47.23 TRINITY_DN34202_c0_g1_i1:598-1137(-)
MANARVVLVFVLSLRLVAGDVASCFAQGFDQARLGCKTCQTLQQRLEETGQKGGALVEECFSCCQPEAVLEIYPKARLIADASQQDRDQDLHDFIKRKAPRIPNLEVEYQEGSWPAVELEKDDGSDEVLRADLTGWKSDQIVEFIGMRLQAVNSSESEEEAQGVSLHKGWSAEIQSCSG